MLTSNSASVGEVAAHQSVGVKNEDSQWAPTQHGINAYSLLNELILSTVMATHVLDIIICSHNIVEVSDGPPSKFSVNTATPGLILSKYSPSWSTRAQCPSPRVLLQVEWQHVRLLEWKPSVNTTKGHTLRQGVELLLSRSDQICHGHSQTDLPDYGHPNTMRGVR